VLGSCVEYFVTASTSLGLKLRKLILHGAKHQEHMSLLVAACASHVLDTPPTCHFAAALRCCCRRVPQTCWMSRMWS
jgi:hypothetical protein